MARSRKKKPSFEESAVDRLVEMSIEFAERRIAGEHLTSEQFMFEIPRQKLPKTHQELLQEHLRVIDFLQAGGPPELQELTARIGRSSRFLHSLEPKLREHFLRQATNKRKRS